MSTFSYSSTIQDQIAARLRNNTYAQLESRDKSVIDGTWASGSLSSGHSFDAQATLRRFNNFVMGTGADEIPIDWTGWFIAEVVWRAAQHIAPEKATEYRKLRDDVMRLAVTTHTKSDLDASTQTEGFVVSYTNIRKQVADACVHQDPPVFPTPEACDRIMRSRFIRMWNMAFWPFRREQTTITLPTSGQPTYATSSAVDAVLSTRLFYSDSDGQGSVCISASADEMAYLKAQSYDAGRPQRFRVSKTAGTLVWTFDRTPDQAYTAKLEVAVATPTIASAANMDTAIGKLPIEFQELYRESVVADVLAAYGRPEGRVMVERVDNLWAQHLQQFDDPGHFDERGSESQSVSTIADLMAGQHHGWWAGGVLGGQT